MNRWLLVLAVLVTGMIAPRALAAKEFDLSGSEDKLTIPFTLKTSGKIVLSGKWDGKAKSLEWTMQSPTQWLPVGRGSIVNKSFELSWDFSQKDAEDSPRPWKVILRPKGGDAKGEVDVSGDAMGGPSGEAKSSGSSDAAVQAPPAFALKSGMSAPIFKDEDAMIKASPKEEAPPIPMDEFDQRVYRVFLETPFYKPWLDKIASGKKSPRIEVRPLGLTVTPAIRKIQSRYGDLSLTVRNITLTPAQNVHLMESITGSAETKVEILIRVEVPGWHLLALQLSSYAAYPGEPARLTEIQVDVRSLSRGEIIPASSYPLSGAETMLLVPILLSQPGEYLLSARPIAREPAEILFTLGSVELYRVSS